MSQAKLAIFGIFGLAFIAYGAWGIASGSDSVIPSICLRAGLVIMAVWLALPSLIGRDKSVSTITLAALVALIAIVSTRPRIFLIVGVIGLSLLFLQTFARRWLAALADRRSNIDQRR